MNTLLYFVVIAASMMGLSRVLPGFHVNGWVPAIFGSLMLGLLNAVLKPVLFVLTLPLTILTLGLFLLVLNAIMLWIATHVVPGFRVDGFGPTFIASLILAAVGMVWKAVTKKEA